MPKTPLALGTVAAAGALLLAGCTPSSPLGAELYSAVESSTGALVIGSLDSIEGTDFLVVCPYETPDSITERLGFEWADAPDYTQRDDRQTVAIIRDGAVVSSAELPRTEADFCATGGWTVLPVETELIVDPSGDPVRVSAPS